MADSQRETLRNLLVAEFSKIKVADGYRTTPELVLSYKPFAIENYPCIVVEVVDEEINFIDTNRNVANSDVRIRIFGHYREETQGDKIPAYPAETVGELLLHDIKKIVRTLMIRDVGPTSSPRYKFNQPIRVLGPDYSAVNVGWVMVEFRAQLLYQGADW